MFIYKDRQFTPSETTKKELVYTDYTVIKENVDKEYIEKDGTIKSTKHDGYLGVWSYELEKGARTYYIVQDDEIKEVILYKQPSQGDTVYYIIEINGSMYNCIPEDNDIIYSTYKEARINLLEHLQATTDFIQLKQQI